MTQRKLRSFFNKKKHVTDDSMVLDLIKNDVEALSQDQLAHKSIFGKTRFNLNQSRDRLTQPSKIVSKGSTKGHGETILDQTWAGADSDVFDYTIDTNEVDLSDIDNDMSSTSASSSPYCHEQDTLAGFADPFSQTMSCKAHHVNNSRQRITSHNKNNPTPSMFRNPVVKSVIPFSKMSGIPTMRPDAKKNIFSLLPNRPVVPTNEPTNERVRHARTSSCGRGTMNATATSIKVGPSPPVKCRLPITEFYNLNLADSLRHLEKREGGNDGSFMSYAKDGSGAAVDRCVRSGRGLSGFRSSSSQIVDHQQERRHSRSSSVAGHRRTSSSFRSLFDHNGRNMVPMSSENEDIVTGGSKPIRSKPGSLNNGVSHKTSTGNTSFVSTTTGEGISISSKCGSKDNIKYKPGGGNVQILSEKLDYRKKAASKVGSLDNFQHKPGGGDITVESHPVDYRDRAEAKINSLDNLEWIPPGGEVKIYDETLPWLKYNKPNLQLEEKLRIEKRLPPNKPVRRPIINYSYGRPESFHHPGPRHIHPPGPYSNPANPVHRSRSVERQPRQPQKPQKKEIPQQSNNNNSTVQPVKYISPKRKQQSQSPTPKQKSKSQPPRQPSPQQRRPRQKSPVPIPVKTERRKPSPPPVKEPPKRPIIQNEKKQSQPSETSRSRSQPPRKPSPVQLRPKAKSPTLSSVRVPPVKSERQPRKQSPSPVKVSIPPPLRKLSKATKEPPVAVTKLDNKRHSLKQVETLRETFLSPRTDEATPTIDPEPDIEQDPLSESEQEPSIVSEKSEKSIPESPSKMTQYPDQFNVSESTPPIPKKTKPQDPPPRPSAKTKKTAPPKTQKPVNASNAQAKPKLKPELPTKAVKQKASPDRELKRDTNGRVRDISTLNSYQDRFNLFPEVTDKITKSTRLVERPKLSPGHTESSEGFYGIDPNRPPVRIDYTHANKENGLVFKSNEVYFNKLPRVARGLKSTPRIAKPRTITAEQLDIMLPTTSVEKLLSVSRRPSKVYSQYSVKPDDIHSKSSYSDSMQKKQQTPEKTTSIYQYNLIKSREFINDTWVDEYRDGQPPPNTGDVNAPQQMNHIAPQETYVYQPSQQAYPLSPIKLDGVNNRHHSLSADILNTERELVQNGPQQQIDSVSMVGAAPYQEEMNRQSWDQLINSQPHDNGQFTRHSLPSTRNRERNTEFLKWKPGEIPFSKKREEPKISYREKLVSQRQAQQLKGSFAEQFEQKQNWFDDYNREMRLRNPIVEKFTQRDIDSLQYQLY